MSAASRLFARPFLINLAAAVTTVAAVALFAPAIEKVKEEAARTRRANNLDTIVLAYAGNLDGWSPVWGGEDGAVADCPLVAPIGSPTTFTSPPPRAAETARRVESGAVAPAGCDDLPAYLPNRDLYEPVGVRDVRPTWRPARVRIGAPSAELTVLDPPPPRRPAPPRLVPITDAAVPLGVAAEDTDVPSPPRGPTAASQ